MDGFAKRHGPCVKQALSSIVLSDSYQADCAAENGMFFNVFVIMF